MNLNPLTKIAVGVALVLIVVPSATFFILQAVSGAPGTVSPFIANLLTFLLLAMRSLQLVWVGLLIAFVIHLVWRIVSLRVINLLQVILIAASAVFIVALITMPLYYAVFILRDEPPAWAQAVTFEV